MRCEAPRVVWGKLPSYFLGQSDTGKRHRGGEQMGSSRSKDVLEALGISPSAAKIVRYFLLRPDARPHTRELQRVLGLSGSSLDRETARLVDLGLLERSRDGRRVRYSTGPHSKLWTALRILVEETPDPTALIRDALSDVGGVDAAFLFGSRARGDWDPESDLDIFVVEGPEVDRRTLLRRLAEVGVLLGREVNTVRYSAETLSRRLGDPDHAGSRFVRTVLGGPKRWVAGDPDNLAPLVLAAGIEPVLEEG